jgi:hypothetical protein
MIVTSSFSRAARHKFSGAYAATITVKVKTRQKEMMIRIIDKLPCEGASLRIPTLSVTEKRACPLHPFAVSCAPLNQLPLFLPIRKRPSLYPLRQSTSHLTYALWGLLIPANPDFNFTGFDRLQPNAS